MKPADFLGGLEEIRQKMFRCVQPQRAALTRAAFGWFESPLREDHTNKNTTPWGGIFIGGLEKIRQKMFR
ncbi:MAG: hypothetical protein J6Q53_06760, partial [Oscillospiraceae bacterium]|nr:hypothetical protein [Oscillospiraceae bacterium]